MADRIVLVNPLPEEQDERALLLMAEPTMDPKNSTRAQPYTISPGAESAFRRTVDILLAELAANARKRWVGEPLRHRRNALRFVLLNLLVAWKRMDAETEELTGYSRPCVAYSRTKGDYTHDPMLRGYHLRYESMMDIADGLASLDYIEHVLGMNDRRPGGKGFRSRMRATPLLIELLITNQIEKGQVSKQSTNPIVMRSHDLDGHDITIDNADHTQARRLAPAVHRINEMLESANVVLSITREERAVMMVHIAGKNEERKRDALYLGSLPNEKNNKVHRVFNNNNYQHGGRFYGHWVQNIPGDLRKKGCITMGGSPTIERDFSAYHIRMLYRQLNPPQSAPGGDPYALDGWPASKYRKFIKLLANSLINAESELSAIRSVCLPNGEDMPTSARYGLGYKDVQAIASALKRKHHAVEHLWHSPDLGVRLQHKDSRIAQAVMLTLWDQGIPSIPLHDSFIVAVEHEEALADAMTEASFQELGEAMPHALKRGPSSSQAPSA